jgi:transcriptional regulator with XRE-family HTH domain
MSKVKRTFQELEKTPDFQEELLMLKAQTLIYQLLEKQGIDQAQLAKILNQTESHVSSLLSGKRNMTLKTLARIGYLLGYQINLEFSPLPSPMKSLDSSGSGYVRSARPSARDDRSISTKGKSSRAAN